MQQARRDAGLDVSDRIVLTISAGPSWLEAVDAHRDLIAQETLATTIETVTAGDGAEGDPRIGVAAVER